MQELLAFEPPGSDVDFVKLELPAAAWGGLGTARFRLPRELRPVAPP